MAEPSGKVVPFDPAAFTNANAVPFDPAAFKGAQRMEFRPPETSSLDPNQPQTEFGREEVVRGSLEQAASASKDVLENMGMIGATLLVPQAAIPAAIAKYGPAAKLAYGAAVRTGAAGLGRAGGTAAGQELMRAANPAAAPATPQEAWSQQWVSAKEGMKQQGIWGEVAFPVAAKTAAVAMEKLPTLKAVQESKVAQGLRKKASLEAERAQEMARLVDGAAKSAAMEQARNEAEQIVSDIGPLISKETSQSQAGQLKVAIETKLNAAEKARYVALDDAAAVSMTKDGPGKVDTQPLVDRFVELAKKIPVGSGFWREWSKLPPDVAAPLRAALAQEAKIARATADVEAAAVSEVAKKGGAEAPRIMPAGASESVKDMVTALNELTTAQKAHGATPVSVLLRARAAMSRAKADPNTSDDLKAILDEMIPSLKLRKTGPVDQAIHEGLAQINPTLVGEFQEAKHFWHQGETMRRMVLYKIFQRNGDAKQLADYIGPNDPQAVTRVRVLLQDIGQEAQWPAIQRRVVESMVVGRKGEVDLMGLSRRMDDWGSSTLSQITRAPSGARDPEMVARMDALKNLSNKYKGLLEREDPVITSRRLEQIDKMLEKIETGGNWRDLAKSIGSYAVAPHVLAGAALGSVFGAGPALFGGSASAAAKVGVDRLVKLSLNPTRLNQFVQNMDAFVKTGSATAYVNMGRVANAAFASREALEQANEAGVFTRLLQRSHSEEQQ